MSNSAKGAAGEARVEGGVGVDALAEAVGLDRNTLIALRDRGMPAESFKAKNGRTRWRYDVDAVRAWLEEHPDLAPEPAALPAAPAPAPREVGSDSGGERAWDEIESSVARAALGERFDEEALKTALSITGTPREVFEGQVLARRAELRREERARAAEDGRARAAEARAAAEAARAEMNAEIERMHAEAQARDRAAAMMEHGVDAAGDADALEAHLSQIDEDCTAAKRAYLGFVAHADSTQRHNERRKRELKGTWDRLKNERTLVHGALDAAVGRRAPSAASGGS